MAMKLSVRIEEVMNKHLIFVEPTTPIDEIARILRDKKSGYVLVRGKEVLGLVTTRDIVYKHLADGLGKTAEDIMTRKMVTISPSKTIEDAAFVMMKNNVERLPIVSYGKIVGMITTTDILRVEPELYKNLLEGLKIRAGETFRRKVDFGACESCGNYSDDLTEVNGLWVCEDCRELEGDVEE